MSFHSHQSLGDRLQQTVNPLSGTGGVTTTFTMDLASNLSQVLDDGTNTYLYGIDRIAQSSISNSQSAIQCRRA